MEALEQKMGMQGAKRCWLSFADFIAGPNFSMTGVFDPFCCVVLLFVYNELDTPNSNHDRFGGWFTPPGRRAGLQKNIVFRAPCAPQSFLRFVSSLLYVAVMSEALLKHSMSSTLSWTPPALTT